eukprot:m51a1_g14716 hypothetical protein (714) ;mRNA; r:170404-173178
MSKKEAAARAPKKPEGSSKHRPQPSQAVPVSMAFAVAAFAVLVSARTATALFSIVGDCDEAFNYYEPTHWLLSGGGMQTWEYSPAYALRSYFYLMPYAAAAKIASLFTPHRIALFFAIRGSIGLVSAAIGTYLSLQVRRRFGAMSGVLCVAFLALSPGLFASSTSFLPSSFAAECLALAHALYLARRDPLLPVLCVASAVLVGWPFAALAAVPLALAMLAEHGVVALAWRGVVALVCTAGPLVAVDSWFYGRPVLAPLNIVLYNVIRQPAGGSTLYGVEPWHFYIFNGILNLGPVLVLAAGALPLALLLVGWALAKRDSFSRRRRADLLVVAAPAPLWLAFMSLQPHKEERFGVLSRIRIARLPLGSAGVVTVLAVFCALSASRILAVRESYGAPIGAWARAGVVAARAGAEGATVCVGKEWYRFPSSFFLPRNARLRFIPSNFTGLLPRPYAESSRDIPPYMNDLNKAELADKERYVTDPARECHVLVDREFPSQTEPRYARVRPWTVDWSAPFLDTEASPALWRAFYVPKSVSQALFGRDPPLNKWSTYYVLTNNMSNSITLKPIGTVHIQYEFGPAKIRLNPGLGAGLRELGGFSHAIIMWWAEPSDVLLLDKPYQGACPDKVGVFATRSPYRPNPVCMTVAPITGVDEQAGELSLGFLDTRDGTKVIDIKPYHPSADRLREAHVPEYLSHWPAWVEDSASFDWSTAFNF